MLILPFILFVMMIRYNFYVMDVAEKKNIFWVHYQPVASEIRPSTLFLL